MEAYYISIRDTARHMQVSERTVRRWIGRGILRAARLGRTIRIDARELDRLPTVTPHSKTGGGPREHRAIDYPLLSEEVLWRTWDNPADAVYDNWRQIYGVRPGRRGAPRVPVPRHDTRKGAARRRG